MGWNHIILEGFCGKNFEYNDKHSKWVYGWEGNEKPEDRGKHPNPHYDPNVKKPEWPEFCVKHICYTCYEKDCEYLMAGEGRRKDVVWAAKHRKKIRKQNKRMKKAKKK
jgi:hypothetical protein